MTDARHKLFIGNLPADLTQEEIKLVFNTYGNCVDAHIMAGKSRSGQSCAFVSYDTAQGADSAMQALNNVYSFRQGQPPITVSWAKPGGGASPSPGVPPVIGGAPVTVPPPGGGVGAALGGYAPPQGTTVPPPQQFGGGLEGFTSLPQHLLEGAPAAQPLLTIGAPLMVGQQAQAGWQPTMPSGQPQLGQQYVPGAAPQLQQYGGTVGGAPFGQPQFGGASPLLTMAAGQGLAGLPGAAAPVGQRTKLFVGNLPADVQQEAVRMVFGHYGQVTNIHLMAGKSRSGQSCAFVEYATGLEAETAILTLNEKYEIRPGEGSIMVKYSSSPTRASPY